MKKYFITISIFIGIIVFYIYVTKNGFANPYLFPNADDILKVFAEDKGTMLLNMAASFKLMVPAVGISLLLALGIGTVLGLNEKLREALHPVIYTFSVIPSILLSPFALLLAPTFWTASLFLIVYSTVWSTLFATITGIMTIDKRYLDKAATLELKGLKRFVKVILPAASPAILAGFVNSLRNTFVMLVYAEMTGAQYGMGFYVKKYSSFGLYDKTWAGFIFMVVVLVVVMQLFEMLKKRLLKWTID
ncbi:MAG: ABC transporter permease subunit [Tyzzerella sp.]|nr:ABC transporter permease subunit [Tyzzerella sp.]